MMFLLQPLEIFTSDAVSAACMCSAAASQLKASELSEENSAGVCAACVFIFYLFIFCDSHPYSKPCLGSTSLIAPQGPGNIGGVVWRGRLQV